MAPMKSLPSLLSAMLLAAPAMASVSLEFQLGGVEVPPGSIAVLVADTADNGFVPPSTVSGATLAAGETIGADDVIIAVFSPSDLAEWGALEGFAAFAPEIRYEDLGLEEGQTLTLYVFPDRSSGEPIRSGEPFVSYRTADLGEITANSTMGFALPPDGGAHLLATLAPANGGTADLSMVDLAALPYGSGDGQLQDQLSPAAVHTYFFELAGAGFLDLSGTGGNGLRAELYGPDGALVAASGNAGAFSIIEDLSAGWHVLRVFREPGGSGDLDYTLAFSPEGTVAPDLAVGANALTLIGTDVFNGLPGQTATLTSRKARPVIGHASLANRGGKPEILGLRGSGGSPLCAIVYLGDAGNVTSAIVTGTFRSPEMSRTDDPLAFRILFTPNKKKLTRKRGGRPVTLRRTFASTLQTAATTTTAAPDTASIQVLTR
jgi:hypothetical protein